MSTRKSMVSVLFTRTVPVIVADLQSLLHSTDSISCDLTFSDGASSSSSPSSSSSSPSIAYQSEPFAGGPPFAQKAKNALSPLSLTLPQPLTLHPGVLPGGGWLSV